VRVIIALSLFKRMTALGLLLGLLTTAAAVHVAAVIADGLVVCMGKPIGSGAEGPGQDVG
jgi:hypothetical protein